MLEIRLTTRKILGASTALWVMGALPGAAQTAPGGAPAEMNLGAVVASGQAGPASGAPSATGSLAQARQLKKLAPNVVSVQPQSQIQKLPDANLAEALQRVPGVSMESDTGAGRFINIRGLDADLNGTSYDGVHLTAANQATPTGGARAVAFDAFPAGMVGGVEVIKSLTPDLDAEGIGGSVNLLPLSLPPGGGPLVALSAAGGQESLRGTGVYETNVTLGDSFAAPGMRDFGNAKPFSLIINYSNHTDRRGIDDLEEDYVNSTASGPGPNPVTDLQFRHYDSQRVTQGFGGELDYDPSPTMHFYVRGLQGGYDEQLNKHYLVISGLDNGDASFADHGGGNYTSTAANAQYSFTNSNERIYYDLAAIGGKMVVADAVTIDFRGSWTQGVDQTPRSYGTEVDYADATGNFIPFTVNYSTASASHRTFNAPGLNLADPSLYSLQNNEDTNTPGRTIDAEFGTAADASFATNILGNIGEAKLGLAARFRTEGAAQEEYDYNNVNAGENYALLSGGNPSQIYYNSHYNIGPGVAYNQLFPALGAPTQNYETNVSSYAHNSENVYAAYGQETVEFGKLEVLGGVRVEVTRATYRANLQEGGLGGPVAGAIYFPGSDNNYLPNTAKQNYTNVFPSLQFKYAVNDQFQLRAAYSTGIARPGFQQISAATSVTINGAGGGVDTVSQGNPSLKPTTENAFDLAAEYYSDHNGLLSINPFYKFFDNYTVSTFENGFYQGTPAQITSYKNIGGAFVRGVEFEGEQYLSFLPSPFDGIGGEGNIAFVDSRGKYDTDVNNNPLGANELPETSPITYNASLLYDKGPFSFELATTYVSRNLFTVATGGRSYDQFSQPRFRLDLDASLQVTPNIQVFAQGHNLTNTKLEFTQSASSAYPIQRELYEQDFLVGARFNLGGGPSGGGADTGGSDD